MGEAKELENSQSKISDDPKAMMLAALAKKQTIHNTGKSSSSKSGSKIGTGRSTGAALKMHRRKAGSA